MTDTTSSELRHPRGLPMLFFAEMWERFCFYGMRALLFLYMTKHFMYSDEQANGVYGSYNSLVYLTPILGGIIAERLLGFRWTIIIGGLFMALGEFTLVVEEEFAFYAGMAMVVVGNGMFKPNISTLVGKLYPEGSPLRDSGFTIFYIGINVGAFASTLICGYIGETYGWTKGFALAGIGMLLGLVVFGLGRERLEGHGEPPDPEKFKGRMTGVLVGSIIAVPIFYMMLSQVAIVKTILGGAIIVVVGLLFVTAIRSEKIQRERMFLLIILWFIHAGFWALFEQAGSSLTAFTDRNVDREVFGETMPVTWGQAFNPGFILIFGSIFSMLWVALATRGKDLSIPAKFGVGLIQLGLGYGALVGGASFATDTGQVALIWLVVCYLLHTTGELCISPIGLSAVTKLAPPQMAGMVMGAWFLSISAAHTIAAILANFTGEAGEIGGENPTETLPIYTSVYNPMFLYAVGAGVGLLILTPLLKKWLHGVK